MRSANLNLSARLKKLESILTSQLRSSEGPDLSRYLDDPVGYARDVLKIEFLTEEQQRILRALLSPPYKVKVPSGHNTGKSFVAACAVNWWYDTRDPGVVISTAPTQRDVVDLLWTEVRLQRVRAGLPLDFIGPRAPEMRSSDEHYAKGYTASKGESFQGRHRLRMLFVYDEDDGVEKTYWDATRSMFRPGEGDAWLGIGNPLASDSQSALEEGSRDHEGKPAWNVIRLSSLDHPNVLAELRGERRPVAGAVTLAQVREWIAEWCDPIEDEERDEDLDFEFPPRSGIWYRPGPIGEARILGRRPSAGIYSVWSEIVWKRAISTTLELPLAGLPEIGCDVARYGDDWTVIHVRWGACSVHHEAHNGWSTAQTAGRLKRLAQVWAERATARRDPQKKPVDPLRIRIKVDDDGVGGGVVDQAGEYHFTPVNAAQRAKEPLYYPNCRSELWFVTAGLARKGELDLTRLSKDVLSRLHDQLIPVTYEVMSTGQRRVEPKEKTKDRIGRSPDDADGLNLAYYEVSEDTASVY